MLMACLRMICPVSRPKSLQPAAVLFVSILAYISAGEVDILSTMILPSHRVFQGNNNNVYVVGNQFGKVKGLRQYSLP